jgi:hypothetical protein
MLSIIIEACICIYCIVNECGELLVEQTSEVGYHSEVVGLESGLDLDTADNPDTTGKP